MTIQINLPVFQLSNMRSFVQAMNNTSEDDEFIATLLWLGHMCCRGEFSIVIDFLKSQPVQVCLRYINETHHEFWEGTLLHMLTLWNSTQDAFDMYIALRCMGAVPMKDYYGTMPWEINAIAYLAPCDNNNYGIRNPILFSAMYAQIRDWEDELNNEWKKEQSIKTMLE